ncbi:sugar kinase [Streptomyces candidus]|uniref:2-dehydro-3-deoxygluconokinase n=1 Tax=Streptomyces candidus TaxID=67283 RepID=A0A7X0HCR0_9ACTN|nr:sugar kinase [Streptomyces candidus]MBB6435174.1 2-dehydro-3-deoxygluconokinase [Streptomyces candidus]
MPAQQPQPPETADAPGPAEAAAPGTPAPADVRPAGSPAAAGARGPATAPAATGVPAATDVPEAAGVPAVSGAAGLADVVCLGESMVTFLPSGPGPLADVPSFHRAIGGAESNVACALALSGHAAKWVGRVGADGFGTHLLDALAAYGVDVRSVVRDPHRPTGVYFRTADDRADASHEVVYYRAGSAASAMSPDTVPLADLRATRVLHLSGITAALSPGCLALMRTLCARSTDRPLLSFDVNHRPGLWASGDDGAPVLLELARGADLVFVGEDEAADAWGIRGGPAAIRAALPEPAVLVVKQGAAGATAFVRAAGNETETHHVPAPLVTPVAPVGAGDAFAAGFLSATLRGLHVPLRLRHGHLMAAAALTVPGDVAVPPPREYADELAALGPDAWGRLRLGPGWTGRPQEARA